MNEITSNIEFQVDKPVTLDQARIKILDSFFELEVALGRWALALGHRDANAPFGQRLKAVVADSNLSNVASANQLKFIKSLPDKLADVVRVRNAIVHSRTRMGTIEDRAVILFETPPLIFAGDGAVIPLNLEFIVQNARDAKLIAGQLCNFLKQNTSSTETADE